MVDALALTNRTGNIFVTRILAWAISSQRMPVTLASVKQELAQRYDRHFDLSPGLSLRDIDVPSDGILHTTSESLQGTCSFLESESLWR